MGLSSIALDIMLAALPDIGSAMRTTAPNLAQLTVGIFLSGAAISAFFVGPIADAYGRRLPILAGLTLFVIASLLTPFAQNMEMMLSFAPVRSFGGPWPLGGRGGKLGELSRGAACYCFDQVSHLHRETIADRQLIANYYVRKICGKTKANHHGTEFIPC